MNQARKPFAVVVGQWRDSQPGGRVPVPNGIHDTSRYLAYRDLLNTLIKEGFTPEEISFYANRSIIIDQSYNPKSKKAKNWKVMIQIDLDKAERNHPAFYKPLEINKFDVSELKVVTPEAIPYASNLKEIQKDETNSSLQQAQEELDDEPLNPNPTDYAPLVKKTFEHAPADVEYDKELRKLLGYKDG